MAARTTDTDTGATITTTREHIIRETLRVDADTDTGDLYLSDVRRLVEAARHLPGDALVQPAPGGIVVTHRIAEPELPVAPDCTVRAAAPAATLIRIETPTAPPACEGVLAGGGSTPVDAVRRVVEQIKDATGMSTVAVADMADIPRTSLKSLMSPSYASRTVRHSTYDKLRRVLDELVAEGAESTVDGAEDFATDRERDEQLGVCG